MKLHCSQIENLLIHWVDSTRKSLSFEYSRELFLEELFGGFEFVNLKFAAIRIQLIDFELCKGFKSTTQTPLETLETKV